MFMLIHGVMKMRVSCYHIHRLGIHTFQGRAPTILTLCLITDILTELLEILLTLSMWILLMRQASMLFVKYYYLHGVLAWKHCVMLIAGHRWFATVSQGNSGTLSCMLLFSLHYFCMNIKFPDACLVRMCPHACNLPFHINSVFIHFYSNEHIRLIFSLQTWIPCVT
jgi:hypothetical protein